MSDNQPSEPASPPVRAESTPQGPSYAHVVMVLDDDPSMRVGLRRLFTTYGYTVRAFAEPEEFLAQAPPAVPACLILDNNLGHELSGVRVHAEMLKRGWRVPVIFLTGQWQVQEVVAAIRAGADAFLTKPFDAKELLSVVADSLSKDCLRLESGDRVAEARKRLGTLSRREIDVVRLVTAGKLNKEIAFELGIALVTVKVHRGRAMRKLGARTPGELVAFFELVRRRS